MKLEVMENNKKPDLQKVLIRVKRRTTNALHKRVCIVEELKNLITILENEKLTKYGIHRPDRLG